jgi:hypothetical protein
MALVGLGWLLVTDLLTESCVLLCCDDCAARAFANTNLAAVTAMHVNEGRLVKVDAHNGLDLTRLLGQTAPTDLTVVIVHVKRSFAKGSTYQRLYSWHQIRCSPTRKVTHIPLWSIGARDHVRFVPFTNRCVYNAFFIDLGTIGLALVF